MSTGPEPDVEHDDPMTDFDRREFTFDGNTKRVLVTGSGPAIIVLPEMPGISPHLARFARWVREAGFTAYLPSLFGRDGAYPQAEEGAEVFRRVCVSAEFRAFGGGASSPVTGWLRQLARAAHEECGGPGVGAIGMCFTGNFAISMMLDDSVLAAVASQPSLPLDAPERLESAPEELAQIRKRLEDNDLTVLGYRFRGDRACRVERFAAYAAALGERFRGTELPDTAANRNPPPFFASYVNYPHSVVTVHFIDEAGQPTVAARDEILAYFKDALKRSET